MSIEDLYENIEKPHAVANTSISTMRMTGVWKCEDIEKTLCCSAEKSVAFPQNISNIDWPTFLDSFEADIKK